ncbi:MAG: hypothetical protein ACRD36_04125 [Candidatus Acidiferrum sp.]
MNLEELVYAVESRLGRLGRMFWPVDPHSAAYEALERNEAELRARRESFGKSEANLAALRRRRDDRRASADLLRIQIEAAITGGEKKLAWRLALDLDKIQQALAEDERQLPRLEQATWSLGFAVRHLERKRLELTEELKSKRRQASV